MSNTTKKVLTPNQPVLLEKETIQLLIEKLKALKEVDELYLTDWDKDEATEDRLSIAKSYIESGELINYLKSKLD
jgi:hypothetical protein